MAVKKLSFNKEGFVSEEVVDNPKRRPPPPPPEKPKRKRTSSTAKSSQPKAKAVKITAKAEKGSLAKPGKTVLEQNVIKFCCPRCSSERVADSKEAQLTCGLCGASMKLVR